MAAGSRKRRRPDGRTASPPLAPSPLLTRNLQLLPVGLTQLPNDEQFVSRLRQDVDHLLSAFAEAYLLIILGTEGAKADREAGSSSRNTSTSLASIQETEQVASPFSVFAHLWKQKGWHLIQFTFADHSDSKRAISEAICRVLLEHLSPYVDARNLAVAQEGPPPYCIQFAHVKQLFKIMAVPMMLYTFWSTQIYPTSGIGVKHCRPAMERIPIEQDYYDWLLDLPAAVLTHLTSEQRTQPCAEVITADLVEIVCRLVGQPLEDSHRDRVSTDIMAKVHNPSVKTSGRSKQRQEWQDGPEAARIMQPNASEPVLDITPTSSLATRLPRTWPSVRVMSSLEANKEFGRIGTIVRISQRGTDQGPSSNEAISSSGTATGAAESRETVAGLSRGDVVRLKARQRLAVATADVSNLLEQQRSREAALPAPAPQPRLEPSDLLAQHSAQPSPSHRARYEIETPAWISSARYTAKLKPWLEPSSTPLQQSLQRTSLTKQRYLETRSKIMPVRTTAAPSTQEGGEPPPTQTDFGDWVLQSFRQERRTRQSQEAGAEQEVIASHSGDVDGSAAPLPAVDDAGTLSLEALYRLAAERTKTAAVQRGETLKLARARNTNPK